MVILCGFFFDGARTVVTKENIIEKRKTNQNKINFLKQIFLGFQFKHINLRKIKKSKKFFIRISVKIFIITKMK